MGVWGKVPDGNQGADEPDADDYGKPTGKPEKSAREGGFMAKDDEKKPQKTRQSVPAPVNRRGVNRRVAGSGNARKHAHGRKGFGSEAERLRNLASES